MSLGKKEYRCFVYKNYRNRKERVNGFINSSKFRSIPFFLFFIPNFWTIRHASICSSNLTESNADKFNSYLFINLIKYPAWPSFCMIAYVTFKWSLNQKMNISSFSLSLYILDPFNDTQSNVQILRLLAATGLFYIFYTACKQIFLMSGREYFLRIVLVKF